MKEFLKIVPLLWLCTGSAHAVIVAFGDGSGNTSAPPDDPGFANIGILNGASAIYLGNRWVMTAAHVAGSLPASVQFGPTSYPTATATYHQLANGLDINDGLADVRSFVSDFTSGGLIHEAQAIAGDSGSGVFIKNGSLKNYFTSSRWGLA